MNGRGQKTLSRKRILFAALGVVLCVACCMVQAPASLESYAVSVGSHGVVAMRALGTILLAVCWWSGVVLVDWMVSVLLQCLWVLMGCTDFSGAFSAYTNTTVWLFVGVFCITAAVSKAGILRRLALLLMQLFSPTFRGQVLALLLIGTLCSPLIPSATAKIVLGGMLAADIADAMEYPNEDPGRYGLFTAALIGFAFVCPAFMTAGTNGYVFVGTLPEELQADIHFTGWLLAMLPWLLCVLAGMFAAIMLLYRPGSSQKVFDRKCLHCQRTEMGKMGKMEWTVTAILTLCLLLWMGEHLLHINAACVAMLGGLLCFICGILKPEEISGAVPWSLILFLGGPLNIGSMMKKTGIDIWLQAMLKPIFQSIHSPYVVVILIVAVILLLRLVMISMTTTISLSVVVLCPIFAPMGIHPFIIGMVVYATMLCWFTPYQNLVYLPGLQCMKGTISHGGMVKSCVCYECISLLACLLSIPYWTALGYFS